MFGMSGQLVGLLAAVSYSGEAIDPSPSEILSETWRYSYALQDPFWSQWQEFLGIADSDGNRYWKLCYLNLFRIGCSLRSTDWDGNLRFETSLGEGDARAAQMNVDLVAGPVLVTSFYHSGLSANLFGRAISDGSLLWTHSLRADFSGVSDVTIAGVTYDGAGRLVVATVARDSTYWTYESAVFALSFDTGQTIWMRDLAREYPTDSVTMWSPILDEIGNVYFSELYCRSDRCRWLVSSLDPKGGLRFETEVDPGFVPIGVAHGRLLVSNWYQEVAELLDVESGSRIARIHGLVRNTVLISRDLGFFVERPGPPDPTSVLRDRLALTAFDLGSGEIQWRFPLRSFESRSSPLLTDQGNILLIDKSALLEISPRGELLRATRVQLKRQPVETIGVALLINGRWFSQSGATVVAYDVPGAPGEGRFGWNSLFGDAQHESRPREK